MRQLVIHEPVGKARVAALALALLSTACAPRYLLVMDSHHGPMIWGRYKTLEGCQRASREGEESAREIGISTDTRCTTARDLRRRR